MSATTCSTFHSFAYGLIRRYDPAPSSTTRPCGCCRPPSRTSCSSELLTRRGRVGRLARGARRRARHPRVRRARSHTVLSRAREKGLDGDALRELGLREGLPEYVAAAAVPASSTSTVLGPPERPRLRRPDRRAARMLQVRSSHRDELRRHGSPTSSSTSTRTPTPPRSPCSGRSPADGGARPGLVRRRPPPVDLRLPRRRGARHPRLPPDVPARRRRARRPVVARHDPTLRGPPPASRPSGSRPDLPLPGGIPRDALERVPRTHVPTPARPRAGRGAHLRHRPRRGRAPRRPAAPGPPRGRPGLVRDGGAGPLGPDDDPGSAPGALARPACRSRSPPTRRRSCASPPLLPLLDALRDRGRRRHRRPRPTPTYVDPTRAADAARLAARRPRRLRRPRPGSRPPRPGAARRGGRGTYPAVVARPAP